MRVGRPSHQPNDITRAKVEVLAKTNWTQEQIAKELNISVDTLTKYYNKEIRDGRVEVKSMMIYSLLKKIEEGNTACIIFACKTILGLKEKHSDNTPLLEVPKLKIQFGKTK